MRFVLLSSYCHSWAAGFAAGFEVSAKDNINVDTAMLCVTCHVFHLTHATQTVGEPGAGVPGGGRAGRADARRCAADSAAAQGPQLVLLS